MSLPTSKQTGRVGEVRWSANPQSTLLNLNTTDCQPSDLSEDGDVLTLDCNSILNNQSPEKTVTILLLFTVLETYFKYDFFNVLWQKSQTQGFFA
jgi:hypothetical protein